MMSKQSIDGNKAANDFEQMALERGYIVTTSTKQQDIFEHWDKLIARDGKGFRVDVKAMKSISRGKPIQNRELWIELHSVREDDQGWLQGKAELIAFDTTIGFYICQRIDLQVLVYKLVDFSNMVMCPEDALYKLYQRKGRCDLLTRILLSDLKNISCCLWKRIRDKDIGSEIYAA
jgi:hypothetical protein